MDILMNEKYEWLRVLVTSASNFSDWVDFLNKDRNYFIQKIIEREEIQKVSKHFRIMYEQEYRHLRLHNLDHILHGQNYSRKHVMAVCKILGYDFELLVGLTYLEFMFYVESGNINNQNNSFIQFMEYFMKHEKPIVPSQKLIEVNLKVEQYVTELSNDYNILPT